MGGGNGPTMKSAINEVGSPAKTGRRRKLEKRFLKSMMRIFSSVLSNVLHNMARKGASKSSPRHRPQQLYGPFRPHTQTIYIL